MYTPRRQVGNKTHLSTSKLSSSFNSEERSIKRFPTKSSLQILEQAESHKLLRLSSGPVNVSEEITRCHSDNLSTCIEPSGWCYMVSNKKVFLWKLAVPGLSRKSISCLEFQLPPTELQHKSCLVCIVEGANADAIPMTSMRTSMFIISPEGSVRFWPDINKPTVFFESNLNLAGKTCSVALSIRPYGCIVITSTNELFLITFNMNNIQFKQVSSQAGLLSNIGRRMSSFWTQSAESSNKFPPCICDGTLNYDTQERYFYVAVDNLVQKWEIDVEKDLTTKTLLQNNVKKALKIYSGGANLASKEIEDFHVVDMKNTGSGLVLLMKCTVDEESSLFLGICQFHTENSLFDHVVDLTNILGGYENLSLVLPKGSYNVFISSKNVIVALPLSQTNRQPVKVEFDMLNHGLIGNGYHGLDPIFHCRRNGLIALKMNAFTANDISIEAKNEATQQETTEDTSESVEGSRDAYSTIRNAFRFNTSTGKIPVCNCSQYAPNDVGNVVMTLMREILDSSPATEPRWSSSSRGVDSLSTHPVLLFNQLNDKENVHNLFVKFLKTSKIWDEVLKEVEEVKYALIDGGEKLQCMMALLDIYPNYSKIIDDVLSAIDTVGPGNEVVKKDRFFSKVTLIGEFFIELLRQEKRYIEETKTIQDQIEYIVAVGEIITTCYIASWRYRQKAMDQCNLSPEHHVPWTGRSHNIDNRGLLVQQLTILFENALPHVDSTKVGSLLTKHVVLIADMLLDGFDKEIRMKRSNPVSGSYDPLIEEFHQRRRYVIQSLERFGYNEEAMSLAEKYEDFAMLILLCENTDDEDKLQQYKVIFKEQGFLEVLFKWYIENGRWGRLLSMKEVSEEEFSSLLKAHPYLSWIYYVGVEKYLKASKSLKDLAERERLYAKRKKMMLVLSSLSAMASEELNCGEDLEEIEEGLDLLDHQSNIMKVLGKNTDGYPMTAKELIELCLESNEKTLVECYQSVFQLLRRVENLEERSDLTVETWCKCILEDNWDACAMLTFRDVASEKLFFNALKFCKESAQDRISSLGELLKSSEEISQRSHNDSSFKQQLQACYELLDLQTYSVV